MTGNDQTPENDTAIDRTAERAQQSGESANPASTARATAQPGNSQANGTGLAPPTEEPLQKLDSTLIKQLFESAAAWLEQHVSSINALNVFPVPDGDTGTNMMLTMRSALREVADQTPRSASELTRRLARGAMMGARGNSGVILSQILNGFARAADEGQEYYTVADMAVAFRRASESAYDAVMKPVEGTILTVSRAIADEAEKAAEDTQDIREQLRRATAAARETLQRTPEMLPILKEAGVVDSGGQGLVTLLEGMSRFLRGEATTRAEPRPEGAGNEVEFPTEMLPHLDAPPPTLADGRYGYDIQYLIRGQDLAVESIRAHINNLGDCPLVVGDRSLVKVHVHALSPGPALDYGASLGQLDDIVVENLDIQYQDFSEQQKETVTESDASVAEPVTTEALTGVGLVAVAAGEGLRRVFEGLGASATVLGGQTMNPSTQDLLEAIQSITAEAVILLPNNKNIVMAAQQAQALADRPVFVVPSTTAPQGFAAMMAFDYSQDAETNAQGMAEAIHQVVSAEVTVAVRTTNINGIDIQEGDVIGLLDGNLVTTGSDDTTVVQRMLEQVDLEEYEIATVYYGQDVDQSDAQTLVARLTEAYPLLEFEIFEGGQPHYHYIFSIE